MCLQCQHDDKPAAYKLPKTIGISPNGYWPHKILHQCSSNVGGNKIFVDIKGNT